MKVNERKLSHNIGKNIDIRLMFCDIERTFLEYNSFKRYQLTIKSKKNYNYVSEDKL